MLKPILLIAILSALVGVSIAASNPQAQKVETDPTPSAMITRQKIVAQMQHADDCVVIINETTKCIHVMLGRDKDNKITFNVTMGWWGDLVFTAKESTLIDDKTLEYKVESASRTDYIKGTDTTLENTGGGVSSCMVTVAETPAKVKCVVYRRGGQREPIFVSSTVRSALP